MLPPGHRLPVFAGVDVAVAGAAAGLAAATAIKRRCPVRAIEGTELRALLNADGARLDD